jgi:general secretion pathway protein M
MRSRFSQLGPRDQIALALLAALLLLCVVWLLAWRPLAQSNAILARQNAASAQTLLGVTRLADEYHALRQRDDSAAASRASLTEVVNRSIEAHGLAMSRFQPGSGGDVQLRLENAAFDAVLRWLHRLERGEGVSLRELSITRGAAPGLVNVSVRLYRP